MSTHTLAQARDPDLRDSLQAMERAALRARELAAQTGTYLVIVRDGVVELVSPDTPSLSSLAPLNQSNTPIELPGT